MLVFKCDGETRRHIIYSLLRAIQLVLILSKTCVQVSGKVPGWLTTDKKWGMAE